MPHGPGWYDDPAGRRRWWDGQRWGAYAPWDAPAATPTRVAQASARLDPRLLHDPTVAVPRHTVVHHVVHAPAKELAVAYLLLLLLGTVGAHRFYLGRTGTAIAMLALTIVGAMTAIVLVGFLPLTAVAVWWFVDLFLTPGMVREENARAIRSPGAVGYERGWPAA
ncbi:NINE protein [Agrococcus jenensis]|uniref:TM2 domain-containing membrane protein YozV n=1 Tax=Agrococcus jenensis TaxID=46353 RepID=A0A3N2AQD9_9MICO|nr:NINE protein [Agrococcus jenensis]ROR65259.1 TM2 domain-containing membrane protein YozV [Agrococcus jenensis]